VKFHYNLTRITSTLTLNLLTTTVVAPPSNANKWQMGFNSAFKGLNEDQYTFFFIICRSVLLSMRNVAARVVQKIETHVFCSVTFFEILAVHEIMWKDIVQLDRPQMTSLAHAHCVLDS